METNNIEMLEHDEPNKATDNVASEATNATNEGRGGEERLHLMRQFMQVGWLLNRFHQQRRNEFGPMGDPNRGQGRVLALLKLQPGISQADLAYLLGMRPQSAGELLGKLERAGFVTRTPSAQDKRVQHVQLTPEGEKAAEQRVRGDGPFGGLNEAEKATLSQLLAKVAEGLEAQVGEAPEGPFGEGWRGGRGRGGFEGGRPDPRQMGRGVGRGMGPGMGPDGEWHGPRGGRGGPWGETDGKPEGGPEGEMYVDPRTKQPIGPGARRRQRWAWGWMQGESGQA